MNDNEYLTEMELYGVSPGIIAMIMFPLTLLNILYAFMTAFADNFLSIWFVIPAVPLHILFGFWFVRYYQAKRSKDSVFMIGILSITLPTLIHLYVSSYLSPFTFGLSIIFPFPLQFFAGILIMQKIEGPEVISPWSGMRLDLSWWKYGQPKKKCDWDPIPEVQSDEEWLKE